MDFFSEGNKLYNNKNYEEAISFYKKAIDNNNNEACSYYNAGVCFIKLKKYESAIKMILSALSLQQESKYYFNLGYCYALLENASKALIYFNMAWSLNNKDEDCEKAINLLTSKLKNN